VIKFYPETYELNLYSHVALRSILILFSHLHLCLSKESLLSEFLNMFMRAFIVPISNSVALESKGSSQHSQGTPNGPYPEPVEFTPHPEASRPKIHSDPIP
jgi:hypothetical protein